MSLFSMKLEALKPLSPRKREILQVAQSLFSEKGYVAASMRDLAEALKIKPASLYSHYGAKEEILWDIALRCSYQFLDRVLPLVQVPGTPTEKLSGMVRMHVQVIIDNIEASAIFFREWKHLEPGRRKTYAEYIATYEAGFQQVLQEGVESGAFRPLSVRFTTRLLLSSANWIHRWYREDGHWDAEKVAGEISDFVLHGTMNNGQ
ncbi:MAG: TetR/AcrR family transcriptional regulator [Bacteroidota bacterium]